MFSKEEIKDAITKPIKDTAKKSNRKEPTEVVRYNVKGDSDLGAKTKISEDVAVAVSIPATAGTTFKVRTKRGGQFYNPFKDGGLSQRDRTTNEQKYRFKTVSETSFEHYLTFLKTKNESSLIKAQRQI